MTSFADVSFNGAGGAGGGVNLSVGMIWSSCSLVSPARDMCEGYANAVPLRARSAVCTKKSLSMLSELILRIFDCGEL